jgi:hypothetical protein
MVALTPGLLMVIVQSGFRLGHELWDMHDDAVREADVAMVQYRVPEINLQAAALAYVSNDETLRVVHARVFEGPPTYYLRHNVDPAALQAAIDAGTKELLRPVGAALPHWAGQSATTMLVVHTLRGEQGSRSRWARFGALLTRTAVQVAAAQPNILGLKGNAEALLGAFASKVDVLIGPEDLNFDARNGHGFRERACATLMQAALATVAENASKVVSQPHWAEFVGAVLAPLSAAQTEAEGQSLLSLDRLEQLMRGPMAQAALDVLGRRQGDFFGSQFGPDRAVGVVTREILASASRVPPGQFDVMNAFSQRGLSLIYNSALTAAATRPELFIRGESSESLRSWRELLSGSAEVLNQAAPPFDLTTGLGDQLICMLIDVANSHLSRATMARFGGEEPWAIAKRNILGSILGGFSTALRERYGDPPGDDVNPFLTVFSRTQAVEIVRIIAEQAAQTPQMLMSAGQNNNEVFGIARAVATFLSDPNVHLASAEDWRAIIAVALEQAASNPGALFSLEPNDGPERHLAVSLVSMMLRCAAGDLRGDGVAVSASLRVPGSVLFGATLREAITMTLRAAANNAAALVDERIHLDALEAFVRQLQGFVQTRRGALGAAEWLWLYRCFVAEVIEHGPLDGIDPARLEAAVNSLTGAPAPTNPVPTDTNTTTPAPSTGENS